MFHLLMELPTLYHQLGARVCNGLTPFNGYVLRTFFTRKKGIDTLHVRFSWKAAPPIIVVSEQWLSAPSVAHFTPKGAPHSPAHIQTLIIMVDLGESKLSHTCIATSRPSNLVVGNNMSKGQSGLDILMMINMR